MASLTTITGRALLQIESPFRGNAGSAQPRFNSIFHFVSPSLRGIALVSFFILSLSLSLQIPGRVLVTIPAEVVFF